MNNYNNTTATAPNYDKTVTNKESIIDKIVQEQKTDLKLDFVENLRTVCDASKNAAISTLLTWTKNLEYYDKPFMKSHECGKNINLLRCVIERMIEVFEKFIAKANEINVFKDKTIEQVFFMCLLKFNQVFDTLKYFIFKTGNTSSYYEKIVLKFFEKYNSYSKFYRNTFYIYLSIEEKRYVDEESFMKVKEK